MINQNLKLDFDDLLIVPTSSSLINSRKEVNLFDHNNMLPLFTAPMDTVISKDNSYIFKQNKINPILPRNKEYEYSEDWHSIGLNEFEKMIINPIKDKKFKLLIDIANGHMRKLEEFIIISKKIYGDNLELMVGNVANPKTFEILSNAGADYIRIGVGNGGGCLTSQQTAIGYPLASLIDECYQISLTLKKPAKIVADGGIKKYSDIIKSLALGANYVMIGSLFNKSLESAGETFKANVKHIGVEVWTEPGELVNQYDEGVKNAFMNGAKFFKKFRGMSTKSAQKSLGNKELKTSEGVTRMNPVEYTLEGWTDNFKHYLASAMSYTGKKQLNEFVGSVELIRISQHSFNRFSK